MNKRFLVLWILVFLYRTSMAQTSGVNFQLPVITSPSPTAASLGRYGEIIAFLELIAPASNRNIIIDGPGSTDTFLGMDTKLSWKMCANS